MKNTVKNLGRPQNIEGKPQKSRVKPPKNKTRYIISKYITTGRDKWVVGVFGWEINRGIG